METVTEPTVPQWLWDAADRYTPSVRGIAIGFAASAYVAGFNAGQTTTPAPVGRRARPRWRAAAPRIQKGRRS